MQGSATVLERRTSEARTEGPTKEKTTRGKWYEARVERVTEKPLKTNESVTVETYTIELKESTAAFLKWLASKDKKIPEAYARKVVLDFIHSALEQLTPEEAKDFMDR